MAFYLVRYLNWAAYGLFAVAVAPAILAIGDLLRARHARYYVSRRAALARAVRWILVSLLVLVAAVTLLVVPARVVDVLPSAATPTRGVTPVPTLADTPVSTPTPTFTPQPTPTPTTTPTSRPTATAPVIPTDTAEVPPPDFVLTPLASAVPAGEDARIQLMALALQADSEDQPVEPRLEFPAGKRRVHVFFQYEGMTDGIATTYVWYREGELIEPCSDRWLWGLPEGRQWGEHGFTWYACEPSAGWEPGRYEIRAYLGAALQGVAQFAIVEE